MDTGKWRGKAAPYLAEWLNDAEYSKHGQDTRWLSEQHEVLHIMRLLAKGKLDDAARRDILRKFDPLRTRPMLVDGGTAYLVNGSQLQEHSHILHDRDRRSPPVIDWFPSSMDHTEEGYFLLAKASQAGTLRQIVRCGQCKKWFVALRPAKKYCSKECQLAFWAEWVKTPEGQEYQRERTKRYRDQHQNKKSRRTK